jgi:pilus assembly protein Flp/PilA
MPDHMNGRGQMSRIKDLIGKTEASPRDPTQGPRWGDVIGRQIERIRRFTQENGQTLVEYGIIVMLLAIVVVGILTVVGGDVVNLFTGVSSDFQDIASRTP